MIEKVHFITWEKLRAVGESVEKVGKSEVNRLRPVFLQLS